MIGQEKPVAQPAWIAFLGRVRFWLLSQWDRFVTFLKKKQAEKLTVMLIPHSEKRIFNFHISVLAISIVLIFVSTTVLVAAVAVINRSGTKHALQELKLSNSEYKSQRVKIREEIRPLHELITEFTILTGKLLANASGQDYETGDAVGGPGEQIFFADELDDLREDDDGGIAADGDEAEEAIDGGYSLPAEVSLLKQSIHNLQLTKEWGEKAVEILDKQKQIIRHTPTIWPVKGYIVHPYGKFIDNYTGRRSFNNGLDIGALPGTEIRATADGIVHRVYEHPKYGYTIEVKHRWGFRTVYGYLERITVKKEDKIQKGEVVAYVGQSGYTNQHQLHYELWVGTQAINPFPFLNKLTD